MDLHINFIYECMYVLYMNMKIFPKYHETLKPLIINDIYIYVYIFVRIIYYICIYKTKYEYVHVYAPQDLFKLTPNKKCRFKNIGPIMKQSTVWISWEQKNLLNIPMHYVCARKNNNKNCCIRVHTRICMYEHTYRLVKGILVYVFKKGIKKYPK